jgi:DNA-binding transcriptional ArsR family regulator
LASVVTSAASRRPRTTQAPSRWKEAADIQPERIARVVVYSAPIGALSPTLDDTFFALSDPTRRGILERLGGGPATIGELARPFGLTLNGIKKHVGILERADLVVTEKVGRARECRLGPAGLAEVTEWIEGYRRAWEGRLDRFGRYVERTAGDEA